MPSTTRPANWMDFYNLPGLYGMTEDSEGDAYCIALVEFQQERDWTVHPNQERICWELLRNPRHRNHGRGCYEQRWLQPTTLGRWIDHPVLLRRGPAARPMQWAVLSQPYIRPLTHEVVVDGVTGRDIGLAPYGRNTRAVLFEGAVV